MTEFVVVIIKHGGLTTAWTFVRSYVIVVISVVPFFGRFGAKLSLTSGTFHRRSLLSHQMMLYLCFSSARARTGLEIVRKAGKKAEIRYLNEVTMRELEETINETNKLKMVYPVDKLNEHQKAIYDILEKKRKLSSGLLYNEYCTLVKSPVVDRAYRNYMRRMVSLGLVKSEGKGRWKSYEIIS